MIKFTRLIYLFAALVFSFNVGYAQDKDDFLDFEGGISKTAWASAIKTIGQYDWELSQALVGSDDQDMKHDDYSIRMRRDGTNYGYIRMTEDKPFGLGKLSFYAARADFTNDRTGTSPTIEGQYSIDGGSTWITIITADLNDVNELTLYESDDINVEGNVRIQIIVTAGAASKRLNLDDVSFTGYEEEEDYDCEDLGANVGDVCFNGDGEEGVVDENCNCVVEEEGEDGCEWTVHVWDNWYGDEVEWELRDDDGNVLLSGGDYLDEEYDDSQSVVAEGPVTFWITNDGEFGDNTPNYSLSNGDGYLLFGQLEESEGDFTSGEFDCSDEPDCTGTPDAGTITVTPDEGVSDDLVTLSGTGYDEGLGLNYTWEFSFDGGATWLNLGTNDEYSDVTIPASGDPGDVITIRLRVTCIGSGESGYSNEEEYHIVAPTPEADCQPVLDCTDGDNIVNVTFQEIDNTTGCGTNGYSDFTDQVATVEVGGTYPILVTVGDGYTYESVSVWIDYNDNDIFEEEEFYYVGTGSDEMVFGDIEIPADVTPGTYKMRVRVAAVADELAEPYLSCDESQGYGETEDYSVEIVEEGSLGVDQFAKASFKVYPNPAQDILTVEANGKGNLEILDLNGKVVFTQEISGTEEINVSNLTKGLYIVSLTKGSTVQTEKVVIN